MATPTKRLALVTGTSSGIGAAVAAQLVERGWTVIGMARRAAAIDSPRYHHLAVDFANPIALERAMDEQVIPELRDGEWARVGLVNNAATGGPLGPVHALHAGQLLYLYAVNVVAPLLLMGVVSLHCDVKIPLRIVNVSSGAAVNGFPGLAAYGSSKAALRMAGMVLSAEWESPAPHATVRNDAAVLSYEPGIVDTPMQTAARTSPEEQYPWVGLFRGFAEQRRLVQPAMPAADIVAFLESDNQPTFSESRLGASPAVS
jgi:benzil reductase ((S)-benzoin forming)